ncbi:MAG: hypothetical protein ABSD44_12250 [Terracidiphilus sp.]
MWAAAATDNAALRQNIIGELYNWASITRRATVLELSSKLPGEPHALPGRIRQVFDLLD